MNSTFYFLSDYLELIYKIFFKSNPCLLQVNKRFDMQFTIDHTDGIHQLQNQSKSNILIVIVQYLQEQEADGLLYSWKQSKAGTSNP